MQTQTQTQSLQRTDPEKAIEFIPYGAADKIKLSVKIIQNVVAVPTRSGATCSERDALKFLMLCQAQRLNPFAGDAFLVGYDGQNGPSFSLITAHQAFLKRAETCAEFEGMESGIILLAEDGTVTEREGDFYLEGENVAGGWARVHRKGRRDTYRRIRMARFNKGFAQWKEDAAGMIVKCAEADALRSTFPTLLGGLYIQGEQSESAGRIVAELATTKPIFEAPVSRQITPKAAEDNGEGTDLGPKQPSKPEDLYQKWKKDDRGEGTDLGPQSVNSRTAQQSQPEQRAPESATAAAAKPDHLKALLPLMKSFKVSEALLLDYLRTTGKCDDSLSSLQEVNMVAPAAIDFLYEHWQTVVQECKKVQQKSA
jgi:phage recombination protein Bet